MAISRILGASLVSDLDRQGVDLQFSTSGNSLVYMDFADFRLGINETNPSEALHVNGNLLIANGNLLTSGNLTYDIGSPTNWFRNVYANNIAAGSFVADSLVGTLLTNAQPNITSVGTLTGLIVDGNISATNITGTLLTAAQPNITTVGNLSALSVTGQIISTVADGTAPFEVSSSTQVANLYATRAAYSDQTTVTTSDVNETYYLIGVNNNTTGNYSLTSTPQLSFNANTDVLSAAGFAGTLQTNAQPNITSVGTLTGLTVDGNINVTLGNLQPSANLTSSLGYSNKWWNELYSNTVTALGYYGTILTSNQPNISNLGNITVDSIAVNSSISLTGNITVNQLRANEIYDSNNRVITEATVINVNGDDVSGSGTASNVYIVLSDTGVTAGIYGSADDEFADRIPKITVDSKGRITNIANVTLTQVGNVNFNDTTISANVDLTIAATGNVNLDAQGAGIVQIVGTDAFGLPSGETFNRPENPEPGYIRFNLETQNIEFFDGNIWTGPEASVISSETITPDGVSNTFALSAENTNTNGVLVSINGTLQQPITSYNIDNNEITFTEIPATTDIIEIRSLSTGGAVSASQLRGTGANVTLSTGNITIAGNLIPLADDLYDIGSLTNSWQDLYLKGNITSNGSSFIANTVGTTATYTSNVTIGANLKFTNWSTYESGDKLYFAYNGVVKMSINSNGNLIVTGSVTEFGLP
jgi:hypothetical protein